MCSHTPVLVSLRNPLNMLRTVMMARKRTISARMMNPITVTMTTERRRMTKTMISTRTMMTIRDPVR